MPSEENDDETMKVSVSVQPSTNALYKARTVLLFGDIHHGSAERTMAQILALAAESDAPIRLFINSPGGHVESGDSVHDVLKFVKAPVKVIGTGWVASAGAHIFLGAKKENRYCLPNTRFLLHQPMGGVRGQASDVEIEAEEILKMRARLNSIIARETGQPMSRVAVDIERDFWMSTDEAIAYGLVSRVIERQSDLG